MAGTVEYERDYCGWLRENARLLREGRWGEIDSEHIAEELEAMGRSEKRELASRLSVLIAHLLKWQYQPVRRSRSWRNTISTQRMDLKELLEESPSLRRDLEKRIEKSYEKAKLKAEDETGLYKERFPPTCPFSPEEILDESFFPSAVRGTEP